jgi:hypothetical protein
MSSILNALSEYPEKEIELTGKQLEQLACECEKDAEFGIYPNLKDKDSFTIYQIHCAIEEKREQCIRFVNAEIYRHVWCQLGDTKLRMKAAKLHEILTECQTQAELSFTELLSRLKEQQETQPAEVLTDSLPC